MAERLSVGTGATGHVGFALIKELEARGEKFRILIRKESKMFDGIDCERAFGDVTDYDSLVKAFEGADVVYHLAGVIEINKGNEEMTWKVNVDGTKNVVEACKQCGVKRLVYASSVDAYPPLPDNPSSLRTTTGSNSLFNSLPTAPDPWNPLFSRFPWMPERQKRTGYPRVNRKRSNLSSTGAWCPKGRTTSRGRIIAPPLGYTAPR